MRTRVKPARRRQHRWATWQLALAVAVAVAVTYIGTSRSGPEIASTQAREVLGVSSATTPPPSFSSSPPSAQANDVAPPPHQRRHPASDGGIEVGHHAARSPADRALRLLLRRAQLLERDAIYRDASPEARANSLNQYLDGWADAAELLEWSSNGELERSLTRTLCNEGHTETQLLIVSRVMVKFPGAASVDAMECALSRWVSEDVVLWSFLDAYAKAELPPSAAWNKLERNWHGFLRLPVS